MVRGMCRTCHQRRYRREQPERLREIDRRSKAKHADAVRERKRLWQQANREKGRRSEARYRDANKEKVRAGLRRHYAANKAAYLAKWHRRRALKQACPAAAVSAEAIYERDGWRCQLCGLLVRRGTESLDHIVPLSFGGRHDTSNLQLAHRTCNQRRSNRGPAQLRFA